MTFSLLKNNQICGNSRNIRGIKSFKICLTVHNNRITKGGEFVKSFSKFSLGFIVLGILLFGFNWITEGYSKPIVLIGVIFLLVGVILSFVAIARKEEGKLKIISLLTFFVVLFLITWIEPLQVIRMMTWLKNIV